jgi:hypothetical protein
MNGEIFSKGKTVPELDNANVNTLLTVYLNLEFEEKSFAKFQIL